MKWELFAQAPTTAANSARSSHADEDAREANLARVVLDGMRAFVVLLDGDGRTLTANRVALDTAQIHLEDIKDQPFWDAPWWKTTRENQEFMRALVERAMRGDSVRGQLEMFDTWSGGRAMRIELALRPLRDASGAVAYLLGEGTRIADAPTQRFGAASEHLSGTRLPHPHEPPTGADLARGLGARAVARQRVQTPPELHTRDYAEPARPLMLIAEDDADLRAFLTELFTDEYRLKTAADGQEALFKALAEPPDLIITDLMMPRFNGERLISELRKHAALSQVPVLVLSGNASEALRLQLLVGSVQDYVVKPFSAPELSARVRNLAIVKRSRDALQKELLSHDEDLLQLTQQLIDGQHALQRTLKAQRSSEAALRKAQEDLAHITRVMSMGELTTSIAHEINQPLSAIVTNGNACQRWLDRDVPNVPEALAAIERIVRDGQRAGDVVRRIRALSKKVAPIKTSLDLAAIIEEVLALAHDELQRHDVQVRVERRGELDACLGDRIQIQQVLLNLIMNGVEAMSGVTGRVKELVITATGNPDHGLWVCVQDCGAGLDPTMSATIDRIFDPFFTTKPEGMGLGLSISRSIVESHGGRLWAVPNPVHGLTMHVCLPTQNEVAHAE